MITLEWEVKSILASLRQEMERRSYLAANELRNVAVHKVLRGQRHGRMYRKPNTKNAYYRASAPGEPPAVRTGIFRMSWQPSAHVHFGVYISRISSDIQVGSNRIYYLGELLEKGTKRMAPRPYQDKVLELAEPKIVAIYKKNYTV